MWIDSHCHVQFDDRAGEFIDRAVDAGVEKLICVGTDPETSAAAVDLARSAGERVFATIGLHPHDAKDGLDKTIALVEKAITIDDGKVVAIGECGLDYYYEHSPRDIQREIFAKQIELATANDLALVIHSRDAWDETFNILRSEGIPPRTVIHCFTGGPAEAEKALELGLCLSFSGIVTFPKSVELQAAARICPVDRMLIETDSPFLTPIPYRGKPNEPAFVAVIGQYISVLKEMQVEHFAERISGVTKRLFNLR